MIKKMLYNRKFIFIILLILLILLTVDYVSNYQKHLENPDTGVILKSYPVGETVAVSGDVTGIGNNSFTIMDEYQNIHVNYTIYSNEEVSVGDEVEVLGTLQDNYQVSASKILVITSFDYNFMLVRSAVAVLIFLFFFLSYWRFDFKKFEFRRMK